MAVTPTVTTARDRLDQLIRFGHRASRYWWLTAGVIIIGGVLSVLFAMSRPKMYQSGAVLYYQERLQTSLLQNRDTSTQHRNIGERYREILLARSSLVEMVRDPTINPLPDVVDSEGEEAAVEELRMQISFRPRGANTFVINYQDADPERAQAVTQRLTTLLRDKAAAVRVESAQATAKFAAQLRSEALDDLRAKPAQAQRVPGRQPRVRHRGRGRQRRRRRGPRDAGPSAIDPVAAARLSSVLSGARASPRAHEGPHRQPRRADRGADAGAPRAHAEQVAADAKVAEIERELAGASAASRRPRPSSPTATPTCVKAKDQVDAAQARLRAAEAAVPPGRVSVDDPLPALAVDPVVLQKQLADVERQIAAEKARARSQRQCRGAGPRHRRGGRRQLGGEGRGRLPAAQARRRGAEAARRQPGRQRVPHRARGPAAHRRAGRQPVDRRRRVPAAGAHRQAQDEAGDGGMVVFTMLGVALAVALALLDDRIYQRDDLLAVSSTPVLATIPRAVATRRWLPGRRR
jgi:capsular polysaccharide biosynthesis protein